MSQQPSRARRSDRKAKQQRVVFAVTTTNCVYRAIIAARRATVADIAQTFAAETTPDMHRTANHAECRQRRFRVKLFQILRPSVVVFESRPCYRSGVDWWFWGWNEVKVKVNEHCKAIWLWNWTHHGRHATRAVRMQHVDLISLWHCADTAVWLRTHGKQSSVVVLNAADTNAHGFLFVVAFYSRRRESQEPSVHPIVW